MSKKQKKRAQAKRTPKKINWAPSLILMLIAVTFIIFATVDLDAANGITIQGNSVATTDKIVEMSVSDIQLSELGPGARANETIEVPLTLANNLTNHAVKIRVAAFLDGTSVVDKDLGFLGPSQKENITLKLTMPATTSTYIPLYIEEYRDIYNSEGAIIGQSKKEYFYDIQNLGACSTCIPALNGIEGGGAESFDFEQLKGWMTENVYGVPVWVIVLGIIVILAISKGKKPTKQATVTTMTPTEIINYKQAQGTQGLLHALSNYMSASDTAEDVYLKTKKQLDMTNAQQSQYKGQNVDNPYATVRWVIIGVLLIVLAIYVWPDIWPAIEELIKAQAK